MKAQLPRGAKFREVDHERGKDGFEYPAEGGILTYWKGEKFPFKGYPVRKFEFVGPLDKMKPVKRAVLGVVRFVSNNKWILIFAPIFLIPSLKRKVVWSLLAEIGDIAEVELREYYLNPKYYCNSVRELYRAFGEWLYKFSGKPMDYWYKARESYNDKGRAIYRLITFFCLFLEYDDYFRYIMQDILGEIDKKALLDNPIGELLRVISIAKSRDKMATNQVKWNALIRFIRLGSMFFNKEIREFAKILATCDFEKIRADEGDKYHMGVRKNYDFGGISFEKRFLIRKQIDNNL